MQGYLFSSSRPAEELVSSFPCRSNCTRMWRDWSQFIVFAEVQSLRWAATAEDGHVLKLKSRCNFAREGRETVIKPMSKLRHLIPDGVDESAVIKREVSDCNHDRYDKDQSGDRHDKNLTPT
jgi:hypothetical protein